MLILLTHVIESPDLNLHVYTYIRSELKSKLNRGNRTICATNFVITITILTQIIVIYPWYTHYFFIALFFIIIKPTMCVATWNVAAKSSSFNFGHTSCKILLLWFLEPKNKKLLLSRKVEYVCRSFLVLWNIPLWWRKKLVGRNNTNDQEYIWHQMETYHQNPNIHPEDDITIVA